MLLQASEDENLFMVVDGYIDVGHHKILIVHSPMWNEFLDERKALLEVMKSTTKQAVTSK